ncbi:phage tail protein [Salmonella enterica subsp. enterica serovar Oranienburg]|uniref:Phage tail protein n=1 Tax=Salmonella enterica TaxID=28901 RepID=A0A5T4T3T5_SALER|nr:phage tail protein [Salmonella enterica]EBV3720537.1 phage tail protein [Salmonella enterica subsp. enterica serovar Oranienburg]EBL8560726.1 phage tail protein [Salmonella enterica]EBY7704215.1 phage tail protein [Salmonella enterica subsp. enterica serovar Oranienburg]ECY5282994.1 phage tail protein [Salmonella enterica subsp. enterica serovar Oranienburg]
MGLKSLTELGSSVMEQIYLCAINRYPNEACGFLVRTNGDKYRFMEARNVSENPQNTFVMHVDDIMAAEDAGEVVAIWHSHTDEPADASDADRAGCEATEVPWMILAIRKNVDGNANFHFSEMNVITPDGFEMPYLGRPYVFGVFDCWMLCRDYLKREFNVELNPNAHLHIPSWYTGDNDILDQNYRNEGLVRLAPGTEPQRGDIFFIQYGKMPDHCAVYIGDDMILHHQIDRLSCRAYYGGMYQKHTTHHLRHRDLLKGDETCLS